MPPRARQREQEPPAPGRSSAAFSSIRTMTVGSGIAPESARPIASLEAVALAGSAVRTAPDAITAGGDFHPALRTYTNRTLTQACQALAALPAQGTLTPGTSGLHM